MKLLAAPNAFKGSLTAFEAAAAIAAGARRAVPDVETLELAIADGGDGTAEVLCRARGGSFREAAAHDALGRAIDARYAWLEDDTAVIDVATASGLARLALHERSPLSATSHGSGELLRAALAAGAKRIVLGVGGSATVDGGAGMLQALGVRLLDEDARELPPGGGALRRLSRIDTSALEPRARTVPIDVACDVDSRLLGEHGASRLFGPQKGALSGDIEQLEAGLSRFAAVVARDLGRDVAQLDAGGAAGGIAAGLHGVLGARLLPGIELVLDLLGFDQALLGSQLCLTGEGLIDRQSLRSKGPLGVARRAARRGVPVIALAGGIESGVSVRDFPDFSAMFSICPRPVPLEQAMQNAAALLEATAENVVRSFRAARN